ncbi:MULTISPECIES: Gfo/Idh/MocA family protein [Lonsdalea]|uniref:Virulence factor MviM n=2 Tax=Lonsdalea TaxID=1082702 RepID=A0ACD1JAE0_9GAMM|nr:MULTISPECIES: Gfo/Idh/MocA family oxidoreductase [Lonsdalea]OSM95690.1 virulence factor MviM [Lonsdalea populi]QPQ23129.1 Gfo/Idh/MocA family oxidoreductase [Lonsdalea populi]RAT11837.1 virulence factor MviM [Lonsdalea quercina]RAT21673.1 virulence factor MviM [Lonsdalea populi]RAT22384.1 virulence factor MviM [Lonsdalea populi]
MKKLRIGVVGLGGIAQKAWLPVLSAATDWQLEGAFSPTREKALPICHAYRLPYISSLSELAKRCDAVFVHSSTRTHYAVVSELLRQGVHVCVDKPLAENLDEAERLVEQAHSKKLTLMVSFNRRFAPLYRQLKACSTDMSSLRMDKHRGDSVGPNDVRFTLLDDYLHVVDTALWLAEGQVNLQSGNIITNEKDQMIYAEHHFTRQDLQITTSMHRQAGGQQEFIQAVSRGALLRVTDMREWCENRGDGVVFRPAPDWQSTLEQRGFVGCAQHFIDCVQNQTAPETSGEQALVAQRTVEKLLRRQA